MKILLIGFSKIKYMPYINFYFDNLSAEEHELHVLYWNRDLKAESLDEFKRVTIHEFAESQRDDVAKLSKIKNFLKYRKYAKKLIRKENFDFIIFLHSLPGVLLSGLLRRRYKGRYIFDYRDLTYEGFSPYRKVIHSLVRHSCATFVSSDGFRPFLPLDCVDKIHTSHNFMADSLHHRGTGGKDFVTVPCIRVAFWGFIRDERINLLLIDRLGNDCRFELHYYGRESRVTQNLQNHASTIGAKGVFFHGEYTPAERYDFAKKTEIIHNMFSDKNMMVAMSNKYYDGAIFHIPQLCMPGSVMGQNAEKAGIGFSCDPSQEDFADQVYDYYKALDPQRFATACDKELSRILEEYEHGCEVIRQAVSAKL